MDISEMGQSFDVSNSGEIVVKEESINYEKSNDAEEIRTLEENRREMELKLKAAHELEKECDEQLNKTEEERV